MSISNNHQHICSTYARHTKATLQSQPCIIAANAAIFNSQAEVILSNISICIGITKFVQSTNNHAHPPPHTKKHLKFSIQYVFLSLLITVISIFTYGQNITGTITTNKKKIIEFATVSLYKDSINIKNTITDSIGEYSFKGVKKGIYTLDVSFIGNNKKGIAFSFLKDTIIDIVLQSKSNQLSEVIVSSKKPLIERRVDRIVFNVQNSIIASGGDALEALAKTPNVKVQNNDIALIGKSGVSVMIDDRLLHLSGDDLVNYLKSISADDIAKIEVITNPSAKYDAQGNNGLINIVLKRSSKKGYNGSEKLGYIQTTYPFLFSNTDINYNKNKYKIHAAINLGNGSTAPVEQNTVYYPTQTWQQTDRRRDYNKYINEQIGIDYQATKKTIVGFSYDGIKVVPNINESIVTPITNVFKTIDSSIITNAYTDKLLFSKAANTYFKTQLDSMGKQLTINADWFGFVSNASRNFDNTNYNPIGVAIPNSFTKYLSGSNQKINIYTLKADMDLPFKKYTLAIGGKLSFIKNQSDVSFYQWLNSNYKFDSSNSNKFDYTENIQAIYASLSKTIKKWEIQSGLRGELTQTKGNSITTNQNNSNNYFKLFPTVFITYNFNDKNIFSLNYGKRINRPDYGRLNPFRWYLSPYSYSEGNPFLQPSFNHNIELSYTYNNFYTAALSFSKTLDGYDQIQYVQANTNFKITAQKNFLTAYVYQLNNSIAYNKLKWLESNNQFNIYYTVSKSAIPQTQSQVEGWGAYVSTNNQIIFNAKKTLLGSLNFYYQFPEIDGVDKMKENYSLDAGIKILTYRKRVQVSVTATDILKTDRTIANSLVNNIKQKFNNYYDHRQVKITLNYKFGNAKIKHEERDSANQEEKNRAK